MPTLILSDGSRHTIPEGRPIAESLRIIAAKSGAVAVKTGDAMLDLYTPAPVEGEFTLVTKESPESLELLRHSVSHIMADAVMRLFPKVKLAIGPAIENGFYYDFDMEQKLIPEDLARIEEEMRRIVKENAIFRRFEMPRAEALARVRAEGQTYKAELIEGLEGGHGQLLRERKIHRRLPRAAPGARGLRRRVQAAEHRRGLLARG